MPYELLITGGHVVDPAQGLSAVRDVAFADGRVARIAPKIDPPDAARVFDAQDKLVTPGLIDSHVHVYDDVTALGIPADPNCIEKGVTTVLDAGSAGAHNFAGFRRYVAEPADTRIYALLNISVIGQTADGPGSPDGELHHLGYANPKLTIRTIEQNRDLLLGVKVRISEQVTGEHDLEALRRAKQAADAVALPLMVHAGATRATTKQILAMLGTGDVLTHCYHARTDGILDEHGKLLPEVAAARERGVRFDVGHGAGSFSLEVAEKAIEQGFLPNTISSDLHRFNVNGPVHDFATTLSKFLLLGLTLEQVVERATVNPARTFGFPEGLGTLREGTGTDATVLDIQEGDFAFVDATGAKRSGRHKLTPVATVKTGRIHEPGPRRPT